MQPIRQDVLNEFLNAVHEKLGLSPAKKSETLELVNNALSQLFPDGLELDTLKNPAFQKKLGLLFAFADSVKNDPTMQNKPEMTKGLVDTFSQILFPKDELSPELKPKLMRLFAQLNELQPPEKRLRHDTLKNVVDTIFQKTVSEEKQHQEGFALVFTQLMATFAKQNRKEMSDVEKANRASYGGDDPTMTGEVQFPLFQVLAPFMGVVQGQGSGGDLSTKQAFDNVHYDTRRGDATGGEKTTLNNLTGLSALLTESLASITVPEPSYKTPSPFDSMKNGPQHK